MKVLRASPFSSFFAASALQVFIFSCCGLSFSVALLSAFRQLLMNFLRSSPLRDCVVACELQSVIFCRCAVCAAEGALTVSAASAEPAAHKVASRVNTTGKRITNSLLNVLFAGHSLSVDVAELFS